MLFRWLVCVIAITVPLHTAPLVIISDPADGRYQTLSRNSYGITNFQSNLWNGPLRPLTLRGGGETQRPANKSQKLNNTKINSPQKYCSAILRCDTSVSLNANRGCGGCSFVTNRTSAGTPLSKSDGSNNARESTAAQDQQQQQQTFQEPYYWDSTRKVWCLPERDPTENAVEALQGVWNFSADDCLTFRHAKPDSWGSVHFQPGLLGWIEFIFYITPGLNLILWFIRGLWPCAVCGRLRSQHPIKSPYEADSLVFEAVAKRDIPLAVRLVRGGADCCPGGDVWCLVLYLLGNYGKDAFKGLTPAPGARPGTHCLPDDSDEGGDYYWDCPPRERLTPKDVPRLRYCDQRTNYFL